MTTDATQPELNRYGDPAPLTRIFGWAMLAALAAFLINNVLDIGWGVAPPSVTTGEIYRGIVPFVGIQIIALGLLFFWTDLATWLPGALF